MSMRMMDLAALSLFKGRLENTCIVGVSGFQNIAPITSSSVHYD
jgi:hypothetical protein